MLKIVALCLAAISLALVGGSTSSRASSPAKLPAVPGELIVGFKAGVGNADEAAIAARHGGKVKHELREIRASVVTVSGDAKVAAKKLAADPRVRYAEPNYLVSTTVTPNDPQFSKLYGLNNTGQTGGTADADIDAPEAWNVTTGSPNVTVAVIDTGVDFSHPDLTPQQWINAGENCGSINPAIACAQRTDGVDNDGDGYRDDWRGWDYANGDNDPFDDHSHGTHVSGTIGAVGDNGVGVTGVNWHVKIMALKFLDANGSGTTEDAIQAVLYAADHGAQVASNSWGGVGYSQALLDAIGYGESKGMLFVAAAGNDGTDNDVQPFYPADFSDFSDAVVAVAATDASDKLASFSNWGATTVGLGAPGVNILSTVPGNAYDTYSGTSMATPHVSGVAALIKARFPDATAYTIKALLYGTVDPIAALTGKTISNGRLNAFKAVSCSASPELILTAPRAGFSASIGETVTVSAIGASCATPAGASNVHVLVNGEPLALSAATPDSGLYTGTFTPTAQGPLNVSASLTAGSTTVTRSAAGRAMVNYACNTVSDAFLDASSGPDLGVHADDGYGAFTLPFPFALYGKPLSTVYVSSNGFLSSSADGANAFGNREIPNSFTPNGFIAPFWDDLNLTDSGSIRTLLRGTAPNRDLTIEWLDVPRFQHEDGTPATFEATLYEGTNEVRFRYLHTTFDGIAEYNEPTNSGLSATAGLENENGTIGKQYSYDRPLLTARKSVSCTAPTGVPTSGDTTAPSAPTSLKLAIAGTRQAIVYWQPSTDNVGVTGYDVYRDGVKVGTTDAVSFLDEGLVPGTTHRYTVTASDAAGNVSVASTGLSVRALTVGTSQKGTAGGAVFDAATGRPLANVVVKTTVGSTVKQTKTNNTGVYKLTNLPVGSYVLTFTLGTRSAQGNVTVAAGETNLFREVF
jgi:subtilisin family serine protease